MRRILYFSRLYTPHDYRFLSAFANNGDEVFVIHLERRDKPLEKRPLPYSVKLISWAGGKGKFHYGQTPVLVKDLKKQIHHIQPDVVLAGPIQTCAFLVAAAGFPKLVSMSWGYDLFLDAGRNWFAKWLTRYTLRHSKAMLGDCETIRNLAVSYGMPEEKIVTFPWGVDLQHFRQNNQPKKKQDRFVFLSTRNWEPIYGVELIARAFSQIAKENSDVELMMLGNGSQSNILRQIFSQAGVLEQVSFPGQIEYLELPTYYQSANIYLSASHSDGSSVSMLEAMACGKPVIVSDLPGNREWVVDGKQGWIFPDGDVNALAETMQRAYHERERLEEMGKAARRLVEERADWARNFPKIYQAIDG
ncbi:MAG: glycosyltransferase family 4 protein [Anaerolineales bacterium]